VYCALLLLPGCEGDDFAPAVLVPAPTPLGAHFDPAAVATIRGEVFWEGDAPTVRLLSVRAVDGFGPPLDRDHVRPNPHAPVIDPQSRGVAGAIVFLRGVEPERCKPWSHGPVRVEQRDTRIHVMQDGADAPVGFVRRGEPVVTVSKDRFPHALRASEDAFFTLAFPGPDDPLARRFAHTGRVELSSGMGYYWMRGHLFVDEHPYYTRTDADGRFTLTDVPPGHYQLVSWLPNWVEEWHERDPETAAVIRLAFRPPVVQEQAVTVPARGLVTARFVYRTSQFQP
jgi:hypothetical protein